MYRKLKNGRDGAALITVIIVLVVVVILSLSLSSLVSGNLKQITHQERRIQGHYLALSGIEMAYNALITENAEGIKLYELFMWDKSKDINDDLEDKLKLPNVPLEDTIVLEGNSILINVTPLNTNGKREVKIHALATINSSSNTHSLILIFNTDNLMERRWE